MAPLRFSWYLLLAGALAAWFLSAAHGEAGRTVPPLDDAFIHFQYAARLAAGHPFQYVPGEACTSGATSFLWPVLIAPAAALGAHGLGLYAWSIVLGVLGLAGTAWFVARLGAAVSDEVTGGLAGILVVASGPLLWGAVSGMEITACACALAAVLHHLQRGESAPALRWAIPLALVRPEGALVAGALMAPAALAGLRSRKLVGALVPMMPAVVGGLAPLSVALACSSSLIPTSVLAKQNPRVPAVSEISRAWYAVDDLLLAGFGEHYFGRAGVLVVLLAAAGAAGLLAVEVRERRVGPGGRLLTAILVPMAVVAMNVPHGTPHYRYLMPALPEFLLAVLLGARAADHALVRAGAGRSAWVRGGFAALALIGVPGWAVAFSHNTRDIAHQQVALAEWVDHHTPAGARIAINDAGAMGHLSGGRVLDLEGIVSPGAVRYALAGEGSVLALLRHERPDYVVLFPTWFRGVFATDLVHVVASVDLPLRSISGADRMVIGTLDAKRLDSGTSNPAMQVEERVVDALDVSDLDDEAAHAWASSDDPVQMAKSNAVVAGVRPDGAPCVDGARRLYGEESFTMHTDGSPAQLVARVGPAATPAGLELWLNGSLLGPVTFPAVGKGQWVEVGWPLPPLPAGDVRLTLVPVDVLPGEDGGRVVGGWWVVGRSPG